MSGEERNARRDAAAADCPWCGETIDDPFLDQRTEDGLHHDCWWQVRSYTATGLLELARWLTAFTKGGPLQ